MKVNKIDHIGIAVNSIDESLELYRDLLEMEFNGVEDIPARLLKTAFIKAGESKIELLQATSSESTIAKFIEKKGQGIHHIALNVTCIEEAMEKLIASGYRLLSDKPEPGANGTKIVFLHPKSANGVLLELVEGDH